MEKVWEIKNPNEYFKTKNLRPRENSVERNPARAYTLSLLFWGLGQNYNDQRGKGLLFNIAMLGMYVGVGLFFVFEDSLFDFLRAHEISASQTFLFAEVMLFCVLIFWLAIAGDAYHSAAKTRRRRFSGIQNRVYPCLSSLLLPGWGQFLNGQPIKGSIFSALSALGIFAAVAVAGTLLAWARLDASDARFLVEVIFAVGVLYAPLMPFIWLFSAYDAWKVSIDDLKKESLWERIKSANNRRRTQGWDRTALPYIKSALILAALLAAFWFVVYHLFSIDDYTGILTSARHQLEEIGMTIVPDLITRLVSK